MSEHVQVLTPGDRQKWIASMESTGQPDVHYHPDYISLFQEHTNWKGNLFLYEDGDQRMLFPYFVRDIPRPGGEVLQDITSPWYYGGPLFENGVGPEFKGRALSALTEHFESMGYLSVFSRYHPYIGGQMMDVVNGRIGRIGSVVRIDLAKDPQWHWENGFTKSTKREIKKAREMGITTLVDEDLRAFAEFQDIYSESMDQKEASPFYRFPKRFFDRFRELFSDHAVILREEYQGETVAVSLKLHMYGRMYGFLGARKPDAKVNLSHDIIVKSIEYGREKGLNELDLGGGPSGSGLERFKRSFSKDVLDLFGLKLVISKGAYRSQCLESGIPEDRIRYEMADHFPEYRTETGIR